MEHVQQPATGITTKTISYLGQNFVFENIFNFKNKVLDSSFPIFRNIDLFHHYYVMKFPLNVKKSMWL